MTNTSAEIFGLFELDLAGTVMYSKIDPENSSGRLPPNLIGLNFFDEIAPFQNSEEIRRRFRYLAQSSDSADQFTMIYQADEKSLKAKVMLTQINEREFNGNQKFIIVDIRKA